MGLSLSFITQVPLICFVSVLLRYFSVLPILELQTAGRTQTYKFNKYKNSFYSFIIVLSVANYTLSQVGSSESFLLWITFITGIFLVALFEYVICAPNNYDYSVVGKKQFSFDDIVPYIGEKFSRLRLYLSDENYYSYLEYKRQKKCEQNLSILQVVHIEQDTKSADHQKQLDQTNVKVKSIEQKEQDLRTQTAECFEKIQEDYAEMRCDLDSMGKNIKNIKKKFDVPFQRMKNAIKKHQDNFGPLKASDEICKTEYLNKMSVEKSIELKHFYKLEEKSVTITWNHINVNRSPSKIELIRFIMQSFNYDINSKSNKVIVEIANYYFEILKDGKKLAVESKDVTKAKKKSRLNC